MNQSRGTRVEDPATLLIGCPGLKVGLLKVLTLISTQLINTLEPRSLWTARACIKLQT